MQEKQAKAPLPPSASAGLAGGLERHSDGSSVGSRHRIYNATSFSLDNMNHPLLFNFSLTPVSVYDLYYFFTPRVMICRPRREDTCPRPSLRRHSSGKVISLIPQNASQIVVPANCDSKCPSLNPAITLFFLL